MNSTEAVGMMLGRVMCQSCWRRFAPSTTAAS